MKAWQLLGPMAAMTGILMFGWSTAVLFEVSMKTLTHLGANAAPASLFAEDQVDPNHEECRPDRMACPAAHGAGCRACRF